MNETVGAALPEKKIVWIASFPKSGNTWFRAFVTALLGDGDLDINMMKTDGIFSSRYIFDDATDLDSSYLYDVVVKDMLPDVFRHVAATYNREKLFIKIHDAYLPNRSGHAIVPAEPTFGAIYIMRNPLDVVASFANHSNIDIEASVQAIIGNKKTIARQKTIFGEFNTQDQFAQKLLGWGQHVKSWTTDMPFPVLVLRYEDMLADPCAEFSRAVAFMGLDTSEERVRKAVEDSSFNKLKEQEQEKGFVERRKDGVFFRSGKAGNWVNELTAAQAQAVVDANRDMMEKYGYQIPVIHTST